MKRYRNIKLDSDEVEEEVLVDEFDYEEFDEVEVSEGNTEE